MNTDKCTFCGAEMSFCPGVIWAADGKSCTEITKVNCGACHASYTVPTTKDNAVKWYRSIEFEAPVKDGGRHWPLDGDTVYIVYNSRIEDCVVTRVGEEEVTIRTPGGLLNIKRRWVHRTRQEAANSLV